MASQGPICDRAKRDLVFADELGNQDVLVYEHGQRVALNARHIATLPGVPGRRIDHAALEAAALYHDAGWVCQVRKGTVHRFEILSKPADEQQRNLAAALLTESLADHLKPRSLEMAGMLIRQLNDRRLRVIEARILADADTLDDIGSLSLWNAMRRHAFDGKAIEATLQTWQRQRDFGYWEARINAVRFEAVKQIAFERLKQIDQFMRMLARHHAGDDVAELATQTVQPTL